MPTKMWSPLRAKTAKAGPTRHFRAKLPTAISGDAAHLIQKSLIVCQLEAAERLIAAGFRPESTIYFAFGHDEEVGGNQVFWIARRLGAENIRLDWVLDEGLGVIKGAFKETDPPIALVAMAEKGHANIQLKVWNGGHLATPPFETVIGKLAMALDRLAKNPMEEAGRCPWSWKACAMCRR